MKKSVFTIDPGVSGTGIAIWDYQKFISQIPVWNISEEKVSGFVFRESPAFTPEITFQKSAPYRMSIVEYLNHLIVKYNCGYIICEDADYRQSNKGQMVAESGDLIALAKLIGAIEYLAFAHGCTYECITAMKWKGQWKKARVVKKIKEIWPESIKHCGNEKTAHIWEAVGIGFNKLGRF